MSKELKEVDITIAFENGFTQTLKVNASCASNINRMIASALRARVTVSCGDSKKSFDFKPNSYGLAEQKIYGRSSFGPEDYRLATQVDPENWKPKWNSDQFSTLLAFVELEDPNVPISMGTRLTEINIHRLLKMKFIAPTRAGEITGEMISAVASNYSYHMGWDAPAENFFRITKKGAEHAYNTLKQDMRFIKSKQQKDTPWFADKTVRLMELAKTFMEKN